MLDSRSKRKYGSEYDSAILEQWKTFVEMADSNTEKRNNSNNLFIAINSAFLAAVTFAGDKKSIVLSSVGIIVCVLWLISIRSYKQLSEVKYSIINEIEKKLPIAPFTYEWEKLQREQKYIGLTSVEKFLPKIFLALYLFVICIPIMKMVFPLICNQLGGAL